jgi:chromosome partitioning protein
MQMKAVVEKLAKIRHQKRLTLDDVARAGSWANGSAVAKIENLSGNPTLATIDRYARAIGVTHLKIDLVHNDAPTVITFYNHAGGVGKTSATRDIGYILRQQGFRVLLVDVDPQASLTKWLGAHRHVNLEKTIYNAVMEEDPDRIALPEPVDAHDMHLIPAYDQLAIVERALKGEYMPETRLRHAIERVTNYDFILIDSPPSVGLLADLAVTAANHVVVPIPTSIKGYEGLPYVDKMIRKYRRGSPDLKVALYLLTQYDQRTTHDQEIVVALREKLERIAPVSSPLSQLPSPYKNASLEQMPVPKYDPRHKAAQEIRTVTNELLESIGVEVNV